MSEHTRISIIDLSKELNVRAADLMVLANDAGVRVTRMAATITQAEAERVRRFAARMTVRSGPEGRRITSPKDPNDRQFLHLSHIETDDDAEDRP